MDSATFFTIITLLLALLIIVVAIYLIILMREVHQSLQRFNRILTRFDNFTGFVENNLVRPASNLSSVASLVHDAVRLLADVKKAVNKASSESDYEQ